MGLVSPQFHCVFDDRFETVKNEPNDTSLWQHKAHFTKLASDKTNNLLISTPTHTQAPTPRLSPYASEFPAALLQLPDPPVPQANNEPGQADTPESPVAPPATVDLPQAVPADPMPPRAPSPTCPTNIAPTGTTCTGCQVRTPSHLAMQRTLQKLHFLVLPTSILWPVSKWSVAISINRKATQMQCPWTLR